MNLRKINESDLRLDVMKLMNAGLVVPNMWIITSDAISSYLHHVSKHRRNKHNNHIYFPRKKEKNTYVPGTVFKDYFDLQV